MDLLRLRLCAELYQPVMDYRRRLYQQYCGNLEAKTLNDNFSPRAPYLRRILKQFIPHNRSTPILDLGCGSGALVHLLNEAGYRHVIGIDTSPDQVAVATRYGIDSVHVGDAYLTLHQQADASFGCIVTFDVIEHLYKDELLTLADEVSRVLKPGGCWLIHVPNAASPFGGRIRYGDFTHEQAFTVSSLRQIFSACGFKRVECFEDQPIIHGLKSLIRHLGWRALRLVWTLALLVETGAGQNEILSQNMLAVVYKE